MISFGSSRPAYSRGRATRAVASRNNWLRRVCLRMYRKTPVGAAREREGDELLDAWSWRFLATCRKSRWSHVTITKTSANGMPTRTAWSTNSNQVVVPLKSQRPRECPASCRAEVSFTEITLLDRPLRLPLCSNSRVSALWRIYCLDTCWPQECGIHGRLTREKVTGGEY